jgi:hypothetical protein
VVEAEAAVLGLYTLTVCWVAVGSDMVQSAVREQGTPIVRRARIGVLSMTA